MSRYAIKEYEQWLEESILEAQALATQEDQEEAKRHQAHLEILIESQKKLNEATR